MKNYVITGATMLLLGYNVAKAGIDDVLKAATSFPNSTAMGPGMFDTTASGNVQLFDIRNSPVVPFNVVSNTYDAALADSVVKYGGAIWMRKMVNGQERVAFKAPGISELITSGQKDSADYARFNFTGRVPDTVFVSTKVDNPTQSISDFVLDQNYPNPFNPVTTIGYTLKNAESVDLFIYDELGKVVKVNTYNSNAGKNTQKIDMNGFSSGVYFGELRTSKGSKLIKLNLLK